MNYKNIPVNTSKFERNRMYTIHEVLDLGPILASDPDYGILITVNGAYYNIWNSKGDGTYENTDCLATNFENGLYGVPIITVMDKAKEILASLLTDDNE